MSLTDQSFEILSSKIKSLSGIVLSKDKTYLLESRLLPIIKKHNIPDLNALASQIQVPTTGPLIEDMVDAMTTNETLFFRDMHPFDTLRDVIVPHMQQARSNKQLRIWCGACSTGQEPYSIMMILKEMGAPLAGWNFDIFATDLSQEALAKAKAGVYTQFEVQRGMPITLLVKYFTQDGDRWIIKDELKSPISYDSVNLMDEYSKVGKRDVVFLRNVLIYFDIETKGKILEKIHGLLEPDGFLFLGGAETVLGVTDAFITTPDVKGLYRPNPDWQPVTRPMSAPAPVAPAPVAPAPAAPAPVAPAPVAPAPAAPAPAAPAPAAPAPVAPAPVAPAPAAPAPAAPAPVAPAPAAPAAPAPAAPAPVAPAPAAPAPAAPAPAAPAPAAPAPAAPAPEAPAPAAPAPAAPAPAAPAPVAPAPAAPAPAAPAPAAPAPAAPAPAAPAPAAPAPAAPAPAAPAPAAPAPVAPAPAAPAPAAPSANPVDPEQGT